MSRTQVDGLSSSAARKLALAAAVFIVYGSLFPFGFAPPAPIATVFEDWNPFLHRADAIGNILLFAPLGIALRFSFRRSVSLIVALAISWLVLGVGLQLVQLAVPGRVASMADAINNAIGLGVGLLAARGLARLRWTAVRDDPFALLLVAAWYGYESFPFVPTLDIGLLAAHIKPLWLAPGFEFARLLQHALAAVIGTLALLAARPFQRRALGLGLAAAVLLMSEVLVAYGDLRRETLLGIVVGIAAGERIDSVAGRQLRNLTLALATAAVLLTVLTPFRGFSPITTFTFTPFSRVLWRGALEGTSTAAFEALAIGALMWSELRGRRSVLAWRWSWLVVVPAAAVVLEALRRATGSGGGDTTDLVIAELLLPFALAWRHRAGTAPDASASIVEATPASTGAHATLHTHTPSVTNSRKRLAIEAAIAVGSLTAGLWWLLRQPSIPYNVRELFDPRTVPTLALFSVALLWLGAGPAWVARTATRGRWGAAWLPVLVVAAALASLALLRASVTQESLDDITGSTDLYRRVIEENYWGPAWSGRFAALPHGLVDALERVVRYVALYGVLLVPLAAAALCLDRRRQFSHALLGLPLLALCWWLCKRVVIDHAITDNLTELVAVGGVPWLASLLLLFAFNVVLAGGRPTLLRGVVVVAFTAAATAAGWLLITHGLEQFVMKEGVVKDGKSFSAIQFLLGRNRSAVLSTTQLIARWCAVYVGAIAICALGCSLARRAGEVAR